MRVAQPPGTIQYNVKASDTLASISLRYNTTPTELSRLNHLNTSLLWPGQSLFVPDTCRDTDSTDIELEDSSGYPRTVPKVVSQSKNIKVQPSSGEIVLSPDVSLEQLLQKEFTEDEFSRKYLKIKSKFITDGQGIASGVFLITKETVMFNPDVSDHLVMEHGTDPYMLQLDIKAIRRLSFYEDIADMVADNLKMQFLPSKCRCLSMNHSELQSYPGVVVCEETGKEFTLTAKHKPNYVGDESTDDDLQKLQYNLDLLEIEKMDTNTISEITSSACSGKEISESVNNQELFDKFESNKAVMHSHNDSILMEDRNLSSTPKHVLKKGVGTQFKHAPDAAEDFRQIKLLSSEKLTDQPEIFLQTQFLEKNPVKNSSDSLNSVGTCVNSVYLMSQGSNKIERFSPLLENQLVDLNEKKNNNLSKDSGFSDMHHNATQMSHDTQQLSQTSSSINNDACQCIDPVDVDTQNKICRSPHVSRKNQVDHYVDPMIYLSIHVQKNYWNQNQSKLGNIMGIPQNRDLKRRQHWFAVPKDRVDQLFDFIVHWAPNLSLLSGESTPASEENDQDVGNFSSPSSSLSPATALGYEKLLSDSVFYRRSKSGSTLSMSSTTRSDADEDLDLFLNSTLLTKKQSYELYRKLPSRAVGHSWDLVYSTSVHGISLTTLYRNFQSLESPSLIVIKDENNAVFGAFLSEPPKVSDGFYGNGESMLFSFKDGKLAIYKWTGKNNFFIKGSKKSFAIGGGEGVFGLWVDEDLYRGRTHSCRTFDNLILSEREDFICCGLEAWTMI